VPVVRLVASQLVETLHSGRVVKRVAKSA
jgi:hypothetical protein